MLIEDIDENRLADDGRRVSVALVDSGFSRIPDYAVMHGSTRSAGSEHGDRILSIFTAFDKRHPLAGLVLHLACYNPATGYDGLLSALRMLPPCDILSMSILWRDDSTEIRREMEEKFGAACVPFPSNPSLQYPAKYPFTTTCSNTPNENADYCIRPNSEWRGNSYAVPAIARLMAHGYFDRGCQGSSVPAQDAFSACRNGVGAVDSASSRPRAGIMACPHCHRHMRSRRTNGFIVLERGTPCPYCGKPL